MINYNNVIVKINMHNGFIFQDLTTWCSPGAIIKFPQALSPVHQAHTKTQLSIIFMFLINGMIWWTKWCMNNKNWIHWMANWVSFPKTPSLGIPILFEKVMPLFIWYRILMNLGYFTHVLFIYFWRLGLKHGYVDLIVEILFRVVSFFYISNSTYNQ